jgi:hypothetical protein
LPVCCEAETAGAVFDWHVVDSRYQQGKEVLFEGGWGGRVLAVCLLLCWCLVGQWWAAARAQPAAVTIHIDVHVMSAVGSLWLVLPANQQVTSVALAGVCFFAAIHQLQKSSAPVN